MSLAVAAPAHATGSTEPRLDLSLGGSGVTVNPEGTWDFFFHDAVIWVGGQDLLRDELSLTVSFLPEAGYTMDRLAVRDGGPFGFSAQSAGLAAEIDYVYELSVTAGEQVQISDGIWFGTASDPWHQAGCFQLTASAPGFAPVTYTSIRVPTTRRLSFDPGTSYSATVPDPDGGGSDVWTMWFQDASITVSGGIVMDRGNLQLGVTFVPDEGFAQDSFLDTGTSPTGWLPPGDPNPHQEWIWVYDDSVDASAGDVTLPLTDGSYFTTAQSGAQQRGSFELIVSDRYDGFASAIHRTHVPTGASLTFLPGASTVRHDPTGDFPFNSWQYYFQGASVVVSGADLAAGALTMTVTFEPDPRAGPYVGYWVQPGGPTDWTQLLYLRSDVPDPTYRYLDPVTAAASDVQVPISDGFWFNTMDSAAITDGQYGDIVLTFTAPGCESFVYRVPAPLDDPFH